MKQRCFSLLFLPALLLTISFNHSGAQTVQFVENSNLSITGVGQIPSQGAFAEPAQTITVTTQTYPIATGQSVYAEVTTDNFVHVTQYSFNFDFNTGNNTQWYCTLPNFGPDKNVQFYIKAAGTDGSVQYDNNNSQNFGFFSRHTPPANSSPILEWFATDYNSMLQRLTEVVDAGYGALWLPPGAKAGGGGLSVGYNPFDRFDFGDRHQSGSLNTHYGTDQDLFQLIALSHRLGLQVYEDAVLNHNDNRSSTDIHTYPNLLPEDFHIFSSSNPNNNGVDFNNTPPFAPQTLNNDLLGLADIAQEDGNSAETGPFSLPAFASFNAMGKPSYVRQPLDAFYYPGNKPAAEDVRQYLKRWGWWLTNVFHFDGFRLDAVRYIPPAFFDAISSYQPGPTVTGQGWLSYVYSLNPNLYIFGEDFPNINPNYELRDYAKVGMNLLDFPLVDNLNSIFNSNGLGDIGQSLGNTIGTDAASGLPFELGGLESSLGVSFVQSADQGPPSASNQAYSYILTRTGRPSVYFDGDNVSPGDYTDFPRAGRFDALGNGDSITTTLMDVHDRYARGNLVIRWSSANLFIYERVVNGYGLLLTGINIRDDAQAMTQTVQTAFTAGIQLIDLTGQEAPVTVQSDGTVTITVPANGSSGGSNGTGYVMYAQQSPQPLANVPPIQIYDGDTISPASNGQPIPFQMVQDLTGVYAASVPLTHLQANVDVEALNVKLSTDSTGYSADLELDNGLPMAGKKPLVNTPEGLTNGYVPMIKNVSGSFSLNQIDLRSLSNGLHILRARVFLNTGARPGVFSQYNAFFILDRQNSAAAPTGDLSSYPPALVYQTQAPSSNSNRLDGLFITNDDHNLYIGLAGDVDPSENYTNGVALYLDTHSGNGVNKLGLLHDDTGPAGRLLSNSPITLPPGFLADFGVGVLRLSSLFSSPEASYASQPTFPVPVGADAGCYYIDASHSNRLVPALSEMTWKPRSGPFSSPVTGLEIAIPLHTLFPQGMNSSSSINMAACLRATGESGATILSTDVNRGKLGGHPKPVPYITNQFLPPLPGSVPDPGTSPVSLAQSSSYSFVFAQSEPPADYQITAGKIIYNSIRHLYFQSVNITANSNLAGPVHLLVSLPKGVSLANATGQSELHPGIGDILLNSGSIASGSNISALLEYQGGSASTSPLFTVAVGAGAL